MSSRERSASLKLPAEIWLFIFCLARLSSPNKFQTPLRLSGVCKHWRFLALSEPSLWTSVVVGPLTISTYLESYLCRSGHLPLDITLHFNFPGNGSVKRLLPILIDQVVRWERLTISADDKMSSLVHILYLLRSLSVPILQSIRACVREKANDYLWHSQTFYRIFTGGAPVLGSVALDGIGHRLCIPPFEQVTSLRLSYDNLSRFPTGTDFHFFLKSLPKSLERMSLRIWLVEDWPNALVPRETISFPLLRVLALAEMPRHELGNPSVFHCLDMPSLETVTLAGFKAARVKDVMQVLSLSPAPTLRTLGIKSTNFRGQNYTGILDPHVNLRTLVLARCADCSKFLAKQVQPNGLAPDVSVYFESPKLTNAFRRMNTEEYFPSHYEALTNLGDVWHEREFGFWADEFTTD